MGFRWKFQIEPQFTLARAFSEDLAAVETKEVRDRWGFIDRNGKLVVEPEFEFVEIVLGFGKSGFSHGLAVVADEDLNYGFINPLGQYINSNKYNDAGNFYEGMARICIRNRWGFIDRKFNLAIMPQFEDVGFFSEGMASARSERRGKWGFIEKSGKYAIPPTYDEVGIFSDGVAAVRINNKWGYIDKNNKILINPMYDAANHFEEGLAAVESDNKLLFIDKGGSTVISTNFRTGESFSEGLAVVASFDEEENERLRVWADAQFREKGILYQLNKSALWKWGYIDRSGQIVIPLQFEQANSFSNGLAAIQVNGKWGYISHDDASK